MPVTPDPGKRFGYVNPEETPFDADGFVGVSPEYQNFANETDKPLEGEETDEDETDDEDGEEEPTPSNTDPNQTPNASDGTNNNPAGEPF